MNPVFIQPTIRSKTYSGTQAFATMLSLLCQSMHHYEFIWEDC